MIEVVKRSTTLASIQKVLLNIKHGWCPGSSAMVDPPVSVGVVGGQTFGGGKYVGPWNGGAVIDFLKKHNKGETPAAVARSKATAHCCLRASGDGGVLLYR